MTDPIIGTWLLESAEDCVDGRWESPWGGQPKGYFSFASDGRVSVQFMKFPLEEGEVASEHYLAYFGTFTVDYKSGKFTTKVDGSISPSLVGTTQVRQFKIEGNILLIGDLKSFRRTFTKARS